MADSMEPVNKDSPPYQTTTTMDLASRDNGKSWTSRQNIPKNNLIWDDLSNFPVTHLNFILNHFLLELDPLKSRHPNTGITEGMSAVFAQGMSMLAQVKQDNIVMVGSMFDGLNAPPMLKRKRDLLGEIEMNSVLPDLDMMIVNTEQAVGNNKDQPHDEPYKFHIITEDMPPSYLRLECRDSSANDGRFILHRDGKSYLSGAPISKELSTGQNLEVATENDFSLSVNGPAVSADQNRGPMSFDFVMSIPCPVWPKQASEWVNREPNSGWPSTELKKSIIENGCHVVPKYHAESAWKEVEWRFSFVTAEQRLAKSLSEVQRKCYLILKTLIKYEVAPKDTLTTYCLKNVLFWSVEQIPQNYWEDSVNGMALSLFVMIDLLLEMVRAHHLPQYFLPSNNLIGHISDDAYPKLIEKLLELRTQPIDFVFKVDDDYQFLYLSREQTLAVLFNPLVEDRAMEEQNLEHYLKVQLEVGDSLCQVYAQEHNFSSLLASCQKSHEIGTMLGIQLTTLALYNNVLMASADPQRALEGFRYLQWRLREFPCCIAQNMACVCNILYCRERDSSKKEAYCKEADQLFQYSLSGGLRDSAVVDYSLFLRTCGRSKDAIPLLQDVLKHCQSPNGINSYNTMDSIVLDSHMQSEVVTRGEITAPSSILTHYLLIQCLKDAGDINGAKCQLKMFQKACAQHEERPIVLALLGYARMYLHDESFGRVSKLDQNDKQASEYQNDIDLD